MGEQPERAEDQRAPAETPRAPAPARAPARVWAVQNLTARPWSRGSRRRRAGRAPAAMRSARAVALKQASATWWALWPARRVTCSVTSALIARARKNSSNSSVSISPIFGRLERHRPRRGTGGRRCRPRPRPASRPSAPAHGRSGGCRACRPAPWRTPGRARCRHPRWCGGSRCAGRPWRATVRSNSAWRASAVSMWSRKPMPVAMSARPRPVEREGEPDVGLAGRPGQARGARHGAALAKTACGGKPAAPQPCRRHMRLASRPSRAILGRHAESSDIRFHGRPHGRPNGRPDGLARHHHPVRPARTAASPWPATARSRLGQTIIKGNARKVRRIGAGGAVLAGFAGATADAFTLLERLESKLERFPGQLERACVELAKDWRTDRYLRRLEAMMAVADKDRSFTLTGTGDVLEPEDGVIGIGSGGNYALAAARALMAVDGLSAEEIARRAMKIAADICVYTNNNVIVETIRRMRMEVPTYSPREIVSELDRFIVGQNDAKRAVAIALRNRWRRQQLPEAHARGSGAEEHPDDRPDRLRQDRDRAPPGEAGAGAVPEGRGDEVHRGRLCRPRRGEHRARPGRGQHQHAARGVAARRCRRKAETGGRGAADHRAGRRQARRPTRARNSAACCATANSSRRRSRSSVADAGRHADRPARHSRHAAGPGDQPRRDDEGHVRRPADAEAQADGRRRRAACWSRRKPTSCSTTSG